MVQHLISDYIPENTAFNEFQYFIEQIIVIFQIKRIFVIW